MMTPWNLFENVFQFKEALEAPCSHHENKQEEVIITEDLSTKEVSEAPQVDNDLNQENLVDNDSIQQLSLSRNEMLYIRYT